MTEHEHWLMAFEHTITNEWYCFNCTNAGLCDDVDPYTREYDDIPPMTRCTICKTYLRPEDRRDKDE